MQTHRDSDYDNEAARRLRDVFTEKTPQIARLEQRARDMAARGESCDITAGSTGEPVLMETMRFGVAITRRPDDPECLRISIGEVLDGQALRYLVFRGDPGRCADLLERAARALRAAVQ